MGLPMESIDRKNAKTRQLKRSAKVRKNFTGDARRVLSKSGKWKTQYVNCQRIELNALSAEPAKFVRWIERTLKKHGVAQKLVPPDDVIDARVNRVRADQLEVMIRVELESRLDLSFAVARAVAKLMPKLRVAKATDAVRKWAVKPKPEHWKHCVDALVAKALKKLAPDLEMEVGKALAELLEGQGE